MRVERINRLFERIGAFQIERRWWMLGFALALSAFGVAGLSRIELSNARENWFDGKDAIEVATDRFEEEFGNNDNIGVLIEAPDVFHPEVLAAIGDLGEALLDKVPYADEVTSLVELEVVVGTADGMQVHNPFEDGIPTTQAELDSARALVLSEAALVDRLVSRDATETWLTLSLKDFPPKSEWERQTTTDPLFQVGEAAIAVLADPRFKSDRYTLKPAGMPYSETEERDFFGKETMTRVMSGFVVMIILLGLFLRSVRGVFVPVFTTAMGTVVVFGGMGWLGVGVEANMMTLPILLGMALSVGYSIHLVNAFKRVFAATGDRKGSAVEAVAETGWPIFFTAVTTIGSVLSFVSAGITAISWLGFALAAMVFVDYLFVSLLTPALLSFGKDRPAVAVAKPRRASWLDRLLATIGRTALGHNKTVLGVFAVAAVAIAPGIRQIDVNMDTFSFMGTEVPYVQRLYEITQSQLGSFLTYNVTVDLGETDAIKDPEVLAAFDGLLTEIGGFPLTKRVAGKASIHSVLDIIKEMNQTLHGDDPAYYVVPKEREYIAQLLLLYELSGGTKAFRWIDEGYSILRAQVQITTFDANEFVAEQRAIEAFGKRHLPNAQVTMVGTAAQFAELNKRIVIGEVTSIGIALLVIGLLLVAVFGSFKTGLIGMIPNLAPMIVIGGLMGHFDISLDMMTMTIIPMLLGIAVDDTIHFINQLKLEFERVGEYREAVMASLSTVGRSLAMTTIVLSAAFFVYVLSPVDAMDRIGRMAAIGLIAALLCDYFVTPALIAITKPFGPERPKSVPAIAAGEGERAPRPATA